MSVSIPTELIGSFPRLQKVLEAPSSVETARHAAVDVLDLLEATGSPVLTDGEQSKPSFATYAIHGLENLAPDGIVIPFADGHTRQLPRLTKGPFRFSNYAVQYLKTARSHTSRPVKQAVISPSALSLLYPASGIPGYSREEFLADLIAESVSDIRRCLRWADSVQIDFTEARLSLKLDPSGGLLRSFVDLNNQVLDAFTPEEQLRLGVHTCPGSDRDSTHSADVDYAELLPTLFGMHAGRFYVQLASEKDPERVLKIIAGLLRPHQIVFVGVIDPINPRIETPEEVCERTLVAARYIPLAQLGTTDDCGFAPFGDDLSTSPETALAKIEARVKGTRLAAEKLQEFHDRKLSLSGGITHS